MMHISFKATKEGDKFRVACLIDGNEVMVMIADSAEEAIAWIESQRTL